MGVFSFNPQMNGSHGLTFTTIHHKRIHFMLMVHCYLCAIAVLQAVVVPTCASSSSDVGVAYPGAATPF